MALGMKHWLGLVTVGLALVAMWTLPPRTFEVPMERLPETQAERRLKALRAEATELNLTLQRRRWAESIIPATLEASGPMAFGFPENALPQQVERVRERALAEVAALPSDVAVGLFFIDWREGLYRRAPSSYGFENEYFFGERDGRPYCVAVRPVWQRGDDRVGLTTAMSYESYLGLCGLVGKYGLPGPAVEGWLATDGAALAAAAEAPSTEVLPAYLGDLTSYERRGAFGKRPMNIRYEGMAIPMDRCFAGAADACAQLFLEPRAPSYYNVTAEMMASVIANTPLSAHGRTSFFYPADQFVAADLAAEFGEARFRQWWTADGDVSDAFRAAFGVDLGAWNLRRVGSYLTISRPGPGVSIAGLLGVFLLLMLSTVLASGWARRRRVA
jgi:hypothetical protein